MFCLAEGFHWYQNGLHLFSLGTASSASLSQTRPLPTASLSSSRKTRVMIGRLLETVIASSCLWILLSSPSHASTCRTGCPWNTMRCSHGSCEHEQGMTVRKSETLVVVGPDFGVRRQSRCSFVSSIWFCY